MPAKITIPPICPFSNSGSSAKTVSESQNDPYYNSSRFYNSSQPNVSSGDAPAIGNSSVTTKDAEHVHTIVILPASESDCLHYGLTEGKYCSTCGEILVKRRAIPKTTHTWVTDPPVEATCTEFGLTAGAHCSICNTIGLEQRKVAMKDHDLTPATYTEPSVCRVCGKVFGEKLSAPKISISKASLPSYQGSIKITSASYTTSYNGDGTYTVKVTMSITNQSSTTRIGGAAVYLSGTPATDGTAPTLSAYGSGTCTATFYNVEGGTYQLSF